jgi:hypothetical protein
MINGCPLLIPDGVADPLKWVNEVFWKKSNFINYKIKNNLLPANAVAVRAEMGVLGIQYDDHLRFIPGPGPEPPVYAMYDQYGQYDVLCGDLKPHVDLDQKKQKNVFPHLGIYPIVCYEFMQDAEGASVPIIQLGDYTVLMLASVGEVDRAVKLRSGLGSNTGQSDVVAPAGYPSSTGVDVPYVIYWVRKSPTEILVRYSDGTTYSGTDVSNLANKYSATITIDGQMVELGVDEDGNQNTSTVNIIPITTEGSLILTASNYSVGGEPWKAGDGKADTRCYSMNPQSCGLVTLIHEASANYIGNAITLTDSLNYPDEVRFIMDVDCDGFSGSGIRV